MERQDSTHSINLDDLDNLEDEHPSAAIGTRPFASKSYSQLDAEKLLGNIRQSMDSQIERQRTLHNSIVEQMELATARHANGTGFGAVWCMNKVGRIEHEKAKVSKAITVLERHAKGIESKLDEAKNEAMMNSMMSSAWGDVTTDEPSDVEVDLSMHESFMQDVEAILSTTAGSLSTSRSALNF